MHLIMGSLAKGLQLAPPHTGSPGPSGPRTPEESVKSPERVPRDRAPKVPKECALESQKSPKRVQKSGFRLFSDSSGTPGRTLSGLFSDSSGVLGPGDGAAPIPTKGFLQKVCGNSAEISRKFAQNICGCGNSAEGLWKVAEDFLQCPLPERPPK